MKTENLLYSLTKDLENSIFAKTVRSGLVMIVPVLMIGAFSLIGRTFPIPVYLSFIQSFAGGFITNILDLIFNSTFGLLSVYMTAAISICYQRQKGESALLGAGAMLTSLVCFFLLSGAGYRDFTLAYIGVRGMAVAIISGYIASAMYVKLFNALKRQRIYSNGDDVDFNNAVSAIFPAAITILIFAVINYSIALIFDVETVQELLSKYMTKFFLGVNNDFWRGFLFVLISSVLWFFGIHGSDCLELVTDTIYTPAIQTNIELIQGGLEPTEVLTKQFFDCFVLMGGCGSAICLLIGLLLFGSQKSNKGLSRLAAFPMIFNINEVMIFGLPVIYNPILLIPFILTPILCFISSYFAMSLGFVGLTAASIDWTTPVLLSGYLVTGHVSGVVLQIFNIAVGVMVYRPFIKIFDAQNEQAASEKYNELCDYYKTIEEANTDIRLTDMDNSLSEVAKALAVDLKEALTNDKIGLYYQPQYNYSDRCIGAEALMRWFHPQFGMIYPPLVIKLADESNNLNTLEKAMIYRAMSEYSDLCGKLGESSKLSVNITGKTLASPGFVQFMRELLDKFSYDGTKGKLCLEVTEQTALNMTDDMHRTLTQLKSMGILFAIDDFSMGQTSINYLKNKYFDFVKLDGSLTRDVIHNSRCLDIVSSIINLSKRLEFIVIAEYVENEEQRDILAKVGCFFYQGYLYSRALPLTEIKENPKSS